MENNANFRPRKPDFLGNGVEIWVNLDKNGQKYLAIRILNTIKVVAFKYREDAIKEDFNVAEL